jgi:hypothetical protein
MVHVEGLGALLSVGAGAGQAAERCASRSACRQRAVCCSSQPPTQTSSSRALPMGATGPHPQRGCAEGTAAESLACGRARQHASPPRSARAWTAIETDRRGIMDGVRLTMCVWSSPRSALQSARRGAARCSGRERPSCALTSRAPSVSLPFPLFPCLPASIHPSLSPSFPLPPSLPPSLPLPQH